MQFSAPTGSGRWPLASVVADNAPSSFEITAEPGFYLTGAGGVLIATVCYGLVRWLRDRGRCPVLVLWQWPWTEKTP